MKHEKIIVLDFGGQYNQLIARRVRECNVYCEVHPYTMSIEEIREADPKGIIFTGGLTAYMVRTLRSILWKYMKWVFLFWVSATELSLWHTSWVER